MKLSCCHDSHLFDIYKTTGYNLLKNSD